MKKDWVDFKEVREKVSMASVLAHYGIKDQLEGKGEELRGKCPFHEGDGKRTLAVNLGKGLYYCFSCKAGGHVLDFAAAMDESTIREAALKLQGLFLGEGSEPKPKPRKPKKEEASAGDVEVINQPLGFELRVDPGHEYGQSRGVSRELLEQFGAGFCLSKGTFAGRFVFPLHNERGELIGYAGRSLDDSEQPKYLFPSAEKGFQKRRVLWNFHRVVMTR